MSVIVPARNEERSIRSCVESICASDYPEFEVIVVDDQSDDATLSMTRAIPPNQARRLVAVEGHPLPDGCPGTYVLQGRADDGGLFTDKRVTIRVSRPVL